MIKTNSDSDITIIGAGPAGSCAAWEALQGELEQPVSIIEEHHQIGEPVHCSGLIALDGLQKLKLSRREINRKICHNKIRRAKFISPNLTSVEIDRGSDSMGVVNRVSLDSILAERARRAGCDFYLGHRVTEIKYDKNHWILQIMKKNQSRIHRSKILISAEGTRARLSASIGLPTPDKNWLFPAIQYEFEGIQNLEPDCVELYFGRKYAPGFFGWVIPINDESARIGVAISRKFSRKTREFITRFFKKHPLLKPRLHNAIKTQHYGGLVPVSGPINKTFHTNLMVVGDAAGQSKATTGGGVNVGGFCGRLAGNIARKIIAGDIASRQGSRDYEKLWKAHFEPNLSLMKLLRRMMTPLPDETWNKIIHIAKDTDMGGHLQKSDIDLHGIDLLKYSLTPRVFVRGLNLFPQAATSLLRGLSI